MSAQNKSTLLASLVDWTSNKLNTTITNSAPILFPDAHNSVLSDLKTIISNIAESSYNTVDGLIISNITGLTAALAEKEEADATILKQGDVVNNFTTDSSIYPASASTVRALKILVDAVPSPNKDTALDEGGANYVTAIQLTSHLNSAAVHRVIDDAAVTSTNLWSGLKISNELASKSSSVHTHVVSDITDDAYTFTLIPDGITEEYTINHNLDTYDYEVIVEAVYSGGSVGSGPNGTSYEKSDVDTLVINFESAPIAAPGQTFRVILRKFNIVN